jgi:predicted amidohydrolase
MKLYGCQLDIVWENKLENFERVRSLAERSKPEPGSLFVLPEMFATGFSMNARDIAESEDGPTQRFMAELAVRHKIFVVGGWVRRASRSQIFNEAGCIGPSGTIVARYAKIQLFTPGGEADHYESGKKLALFRWGGLKVAVFICYDLRFPELFRLAAQRGAEAFIVIANWPAKRHSHWLTLLQARAIENQAFVIGVNRCGEDPKLEYAGGSLVIDPQGNTITAGKRRESLLVASLDSSAPKRWRHDFPALKDVRSTFKLGAA